MKYTNKRQFFEKLLAHESTSSDLSIEKIMENFNCKRENIGNCIEDFDKNNIYIYI